MKSENKNLALSPKIVEQERLRGLILQRCGGHHRFMHGQRCNQLAVIGRVRGVLVSSLIHAAASNARALVTVQEMTSACTRMFLGDVAIFPFSGTSDLMPIRSPRGNESG